MRKWINLVEGANGFPTRSFPYLLHVGSMNPAEKRNDSHEGHGLSVSLHPNAWRRIARGWVDGQLHKLTKPGNQFLDYHAMTTEQRALIREWGFRNDLLVPIGSTYRIAYYDDELGEETYQEFDTLEDAEAENEYIEGEITEHKDGFKITPKLAQLCRLSGNHYVNILDFAVIIYAEQVLHLDGIWWQDRFDPSNYSAPRGVIFPDRVSTFTVSEPQPGDEDGDDDDFYDEDGDA